MLHNQRFDAQCNDEDGYDVMMRWLKRDREKERERVKCMEYLVIKGCT